MSSKLPLVSVVTPCFNDGSYILECVRSVQNSNYLNIEHIIVDDGSEKETKEFLKKLNFPNVRVFYKENGGVCSARNYAINKAHGDIILPLDGDDTISPNYISDAVRLFQSNDNIRIVTSEISQMFGFNNGVIKVAQPVDMGLLLSRNLFTVSTLFKKEDCIRIGGFDEGFKEGLEDWDFWISILELGGDVGVVPGVNFYYRIKRRHRNTGMGGEPVVRKLYKRIWEKHRALFSIYYADLFETYAYKTLKSFRDASLISIINIKVRELIKRVIGSD